MLNGTTRNVSLFARGGAVGIATIADTGERIFTELPRVRTHRNTDKTRYRWYNEYRLPDHLGGGTISVRLHGNKDDEQRRFNRTENVRPIPPPTPTSPPCTGGATTPNPSTVPSTTPSGSAEPTASATNANTSTCSPTPSASTPSPCTATGEREATHQSHKPHNPGGSDMQGGSGAPAEADFRRPGRFVREINVEGPR